MSALDEQTAQLCEVFQDADPSYLRSVLRDVAARSPGSDPIPLAMESLLSNGYTRQNSGSDIGRAAPSSPVPAPPPVRSKAPAPLVILDHPGPSEKPLHSGEKRKEPDEVKDDDILESVGLVLVPPKAPKKNPAIVTLAQLFPDCEESHIEELWGATPGDEDSKLQQVSNVLLERRYPKKAKVIAIEEELPARPRDYAQVLKKDWYKMDETCSALYVEKALATLCNKFTRVPKGHIRQRMKESNFHLAPAHRLLQADLLLARPPFRPLRSHRVPEPMPAGKHEGFEQELWFITNEKVAAQEQEDHRIAEEMNKKEYEESGQMIECGCCCCEFPFDDMAQCEDGHLFCQECCKKGSKELIGSGKTSLTCFKFGCKYKFPLWEVKKFLDEKTMAWFEKAVQDEELRTANIPNLEKCPLCNFAVIIDNPDEKVFKCGQCHKETCRLCKEESHIPLRCNEVEKKAAKDARLLIEQQMTDALIRKCPRCKKPFFKEEGCNHMKCPCGTEICYVCRAVIKGYTHFGQGKCPQNYTDTKKVDAAEVDKAAKDAIAQVRKDHPELKDDLEKLADVIKKNFMDEPKSKKKPKKGWMGRLWCV